MRVGRVQRDVAEPFVFEHAAPNEEAPDDEHGDRAGGDCDARPANETHAGSRARRRDSSPKSATSTTLRASTSHDTVPS